MLMAVKFLLVVAIAIASSFLARHAGPGWNFPPYRQTPS
jgi:hypothetical protein